ncbi:large ribosomal subunit protein uL23m-like [Clytia hemisphaerica]|uniref:Large ribosomal subunit protein uL23m n=1 Tax=Clytia hemisphaerica TaxID=252671 RepID=A0A7M5V0R9_9CNID
MAYRNRVRNPVLQARIFLPKWFVKVVRPGRDLPDDTVQLHVPLDMSKIDIKNYMEKIYNVPVAKVNTRIQAGKVKTKVYRNDAIQYKQEDIKVAYVILKEGRFKFPDVFPPDAKAEIVDDDLDDIDDNEGNVPEKQSDSGQQQQSWFNL